MISNLLSRLGLLPGLLLLGLLLGVVRPAGATHLLGGEMTYRYLDATGPVGAPLRYELTVMVYNNCGSSGITAPRPSASVGIYEQATGKRLVLTTINYSYTTTFTNQTGMMSIPQTSLTACISPTIPPGCTISGVSQPYQLQKFVGVVNLPMTTTGYYALFTDGARNVDITNLYDPGNQALTLYTALTPPQLPNHSPVFSDEAVAIVCANDTTYLLNNAVDADGDRLVYSFGQPYAMTSSLPVTSFSPLPSLAQYTSGAGYAPATPFGTGAGNFALLNPSTGLAKYGAATVGRKYVVAVDVKEYRTINGQEVLIGTTRRDLQLVVASCPPTKTPVLPPITTMPRTYTMEAGSTLTIPITATQSDGHPLTMTLNSVLLDGPGGYNAMLNSDPGTVAPGNPTGVATVRGPSGTVTGTLVFVAGCGYARPKSFDVALTVKDTGCAGKTVADVLHITVTQPPGPQAISGNLQVCSLDMPYSYSATGGTAPKISWRVVGGTFVGSNTTNPVQVKWTTAGTGTLVARGLTQYGCPTDSVTQRVLIAPVPSLVVTGKLTTCQGTSTTLTVTGGTAPYTLTGGPTPLTGAGPFVLSPNQTTTYTFAGMPNAAGCSSTAQATITVNPLPQALAGAAATLCAGGTAQLGAAPVAGLTYSWSPATGLSSATAANPTVSLPNTTSAPITQIYTLTTTSATGCAATATVAVTVNPLPPALAGAAATLCTGGTAQLGAAPVAGLTYSWSPATGLSSATAANPTVSLPNTTSAPITQIYTLTTTSAAGCAATATVAVLVNPAVQPGSLGADQTVCPGTAPGALTSTAGASGGAGTYAYQWESSPDNATWAAIGGATGPGYAPGPATSTMYYRRRVASGGCSTAVTSAVAVRLQPVLTVGVALATPPTQCAGTALTFSPVPTNAGAAPTYRWFVNNTLVATSPTYTSTTLGNADQVRVELTATPGSCVSGPAVATVAVSLTPVALPTVTISRPNALPVCVGTPVVFTLDQATNQGASPQYQWQVDGVAVAGAQGPTFSSTTLRDGQTVTLALRAPTVCGPVTVVSNGVRALISPAVDVEAGPDKVITEGDQVVLEGQANGSYPVVWTPAQSLTIGTANPLRPVAAPTVTTTYTLSAGVGNCADRSSVTVTVLPRLRIPNAFSPNGDGRDDTWQIDHINDYSTNRVLVFNRWGNKIFEASGYHSGGEWNGTIGGQPVPVGTYYYVITLSSGKSYSGALTVVY
ncbi:T9SS type B sorting domain-containing protein [Hymenobacter sp. UV11]|uniref:gliding motility-associated C-terminal domain-containing protein n=1 Tax=Hymenobacter sp. UV11 TaxID=1849735 RepID=UPI00106212B8|nr:gliding motility-associated C-terminal domain-containing protein [Hymenobacter sp. UV11]TDN36427.1 hypothetical protein A8B98_08690 [Hymenobacter sp. UV11]TFZ64526.1 T9SS type B sorting domain-containing protein [Hymenobacter sp. UV11]